MYVGIDILLPLLLLINNCNIKAKSSISSNNNINNDNKDKDNNTKNNRDNNSNNHSNNDNNDNIRMKMMRWIDNKKKKNIAMMLQKS